MDWGLTLKQMTQKKNEKLLSKMKRKSLFPNQMVYCEQHIECFTENKVYYIFHKQNMVVNYE